MTRTHTPRIPGKCPTFRPPALLLLYHVCFDNTDNLPGDDDDDYTGDISTFDMETTDDEFVEIFRKQVTL